jgi:hypothetical protein
MRSLKKLTKLFSGPAGLKFFSSGGTPWLQAGQRPAATPAIYARSDRLIVKLFREEVTPHLDLILDGSRSMNLADTAKAGAVARLAALLPPPPPTRNAPRPSGFPAKVFGACPMTRSHRPPGTNWS